MFNLSGILETANAPIVAPLPYETPNTEQVARLEAFLRQPLELMAMTKKVELFEMPAELFSLNVKAPEVQGDRPVATITFSDDGWDQMSYRYLQHMAEAARKDPKSVPRSMRPFAKLMNKLPERPTGNGAVDSGRRVVIEKNIQAISPAIRDILVQRLRAWRP